MIKDPKHDRNMIDDAGDLARHTARHAGGVPAMLASAFALIFSGISLYQTVIKQAQFHVFVPDTIAYTRDPDGSFEVFAIPVTVANSGARDGIVSSMALEVTNKETGASKTLQASYVTLPGYFSTKEDITENKRRPKTPFAPLSVAGRSSVTTTILFYGREYEETRVVPGKGEYEIRLSSGARPTEAMGFIDKLWTTEIEPVALTFQLPQVSRYFEGRMLVGHTARMFRVE